MIISDPEKYDFTPKGDLTKAATKGKVDKWHSREKTARKLLHRVGILAVTALVYFGAQRYTELSELESHLQEVSSFRLSLADTLLDTSKTESLFLSIPNNKSALATSRSYATHPHVAGSSEDFEDAKTILELFQTYLMVPEPEADPIFPAGSAESRNATLGATSISAPQAWIDIYYPVMNMPLDRSLEILGDDGKPIWSADLEEDGDERDPEAAKYKLAVPTFHGLSCDGDVEGQLIYANYGSKEDYDKLVEKGVNFTGKIVIARYGGLFRGLKVEGAQILGAAGVLIYSDPRDDGSVTVENGYKPYPEGPARNPTSVQRGSVQFLSKYPGDPTTPGYPAYENSTRSEGVNIPTIPSLPISWANAKKLLEEIGDADSNKMLTGKASEKSVRLVNHVDTKVTPIWNTMAAIPGHIRDEVVVIGNHRDAWVMGAADPTSGTVSLHELIRGFGALLRSGWKPLRTIVFASWDAEEYGLIGSTEWAEDFADWIQSHVVTYLNLDSSVSGSSWRAGSSPSLAHLIRQTALEIPHPTNPEKTLWDARTEKGPFFGEVDADVLTEFVYPQNSIFSSSTGVSALGSGSDYTAFLQRLGVASSNEGFGSTLSDAVYHYHSIYDSQRFQELYADPGFHRHVAVAKHLGLQALRLIDAIILPLNTTQYAIELGQYLDKVEEIAFNTKQDVDFSGLRISVTGLHRASLALDDEKVEAEKKFRELLEQLPKPGGLCRHDSMLRRFYSWLKSSTGVMADNVGCQHCKKEFEEHFSKVFSPLRDDGDMNIILRDLQPEIDARVETAFPMRKFIRAAKRVQKANSMLVAFERGFISEGGISGREWYKHLVVAPGKWLGYGATTLPALTESLTIDKNTTLAVYEISRLISLLDTLADEISI